MASKIIEYNIEARSKLKSGVDKLANAVKVTLGPRGRNVVIKEGFMTPTITKDGVTVAKQIRLKDPIEDTGAQIIRQVASRTSDYAGDGPQPLYSKVLTPNGWKTLGSIEVGDEICGTNKSTQTVLGVYDKGVLKTYKVTFSDGRVVRCSGTHLWTVTTNYGSKKTMTVNELIDSGKISVKQKDGSFSYGYYVQRNIVDFVDKEVPIDSYTLGVLLGDGSLGATHRGNVELSIGVKKEHILDKLVLPEGVTKTVTLVPEKNYFRVKFQGSGLKEALDTLGLLRVDSKTKFIPNEYLYNSLDKRTNLLKGLLDTDGHTNKRGTFEFSTVGDQLKDDFMELCYGLDISLNYKLHTREKDPNSYSNNSIHRITQLKGYKYGSKIVSIESDDCVEPMRCIKVSNQDHLYITDGYIPTHNTTTATVLAQIIIEEGMKNLSTGANPMDIKRGIDNATSRIITFLKAISSPVSSKEQISQVGTISANNDKDIGDIIANAMSVVSKDGVITVEESATTETYLDVVEGLNFARGYVSPYFVTKQETMTVEYEDAFLLFYDGFVNSLGEIPREILEELAKTQKPLVVIAEDFSNDAVGHFVLNKIRSGFKTVLVKAPGFGNNRLNNLEDIAIVTGGSVVTKETATKLSDLTMGMLGRCDRIIVAKEATTIIGGAGKKEKIEDRINVLKMNAASANSDYDKDKYQERISKLSGGVAVLYIGASSEVEMKEKKARVEDALHATRAAVEEGIVPGGGVALLRALDVIAEDTVVGLSKDESIGFSIIRKALEAPIRTILANAGIEPSYVIEKVKAGETNFGFNARSEEYGDMIEMGVIDPTKVTRTAIENAASVAGILLTTEAVIVDDPETLRALPQDMEQIGF